MSAIARIEAHFARLWPGQRLAPILLPAPFVLWDVWRLIDGERRWEQMAVCVVAVVLAWASQATKRLFLGLYPLGLLGLLYDAMRFVKDVGVTPERVHLCDLRAIDATLFGVGSGDSAMTVHDWFRTHSSTALDLICALPYGTFIFATIGFSIYLYRRDYAAMQAFGWTFFLVNLVGFITYHVYPAAPPWYFHAHGCSVDLLAKASEGPNLAHVDSLLGIGYFHGFYGRSNDVFGAVPSLHVAYPMLILLYGWKRVGTLGRAASIAFLVSMAFAAVYLDHHWIVDVLLGAVYTLVVYAGVTYARSRGREPRSSPVHAARSIVSLASTASKRRA